jgi:small-conductance mechanosensitive channel
MTARVYEALCREQIAIPFPQQDLHLRTMSADVASQLARARAETAAATPPQAPAAP